MNPASIGAGEEMEKEYKAAIERLNRMTDAEVNDAYFKAQRRGALPPPPLNPIIGREK